MNKTKISAAEKQEQTTVTDYLTDFLRSSARKMLQLAVTQEVELFTWEKLDYIEQIKKEFNI